MSIRVKERRGPERALTAVVAALIVVLSILPMLRLVMEIVAPNGTLSGAAINAGLASRATWVATGHSLVVGIGGTVLAVILGTVVAVLVTLTDVRGRGAFVLCFVTPLMIAPQVLSLIHI